MKLALGERENRMNRRIEYNRIEQNRIEQNIFINPPTRLTNDLSAHPYLQCQSILTAGRGPSVSASANAGELQDDDGQPDRMEQSCIIPGALSVLMPLDR